MADEIREEYLQWCKDRALAYCDRGELQLALDSLISDLAKRKDTHDPYLMEWFVAQWADGKITTREHMRALIDSVGLFDVYPERELGCVGFYGFGGGWAKGKGYIFAANALYCQLCVLRFTCWDKHKERVANMAPNLVAKFEELANDLKGPKLVKKWVEQYQTADPYSQVLAGNIADGMAVAHIGKPLDRGPKFTVPWPFNQTN